MYIQFEEGHYWVDIYDQCPPVDIDRQQKCCSEKLEALSRKIKRDYWCSPSKRLKDPREMVAQIHIGKQSDLGCMVCEQWQDRKAWITHMCTASLLF